MKTSKKDEILDCAQILIQTQGYNGFSYAHISTAVGIRKASIHHYFPTKEDLVVSVIERYRETFNISLANIDIQNTWHQKIDLYAELYKQVLNENKLCLCGMLASDVETLPEQARKSIQHFFADNVDWLVHVLKNINPGFSPNRLNCIAWQIINTLQGGVMMARVLNEPNIFSLSYKEMMFQLKSLAVMK